MTALSVLPLTPPSQPRSFKADVLLVHNLLNHQVSSTDSACMKKSHSIAVFFPYGVATICFAASIDRGIADHGRWARPSETVALFFSLL